MTWTRSPNFDSDKMFKRSFNTKDGRVTKAKPIKTTYGEYAKRKMQNSLDSPPVGRSANTTSLGKHTTDTNQHSH